MSWNPLNLPVCECGHVEGDHRNVTSWPHPPTRGMCLFHDQCGCVRFTPVELEQAA